MPFACYTALAVFSLVAESYLKPFLFWKNIQNCILCLVFVDPVYLFCMHIDVRHVARKVLSSGRL